MNFKRLFFLLKISKPNHLSLGLGSAKALSTVYAYFLVYYFQFLNFVLCTEIRNQKVEMEANPIRAPKVPFNFQFKIEMEKDIFANFNFLIQN